MGSIRHVSEVPIKRKSRPGMNLSIPKYHESTSPMPMLTSTWSRDAILTPIESPEDTSNNFWGQNEGSVVSSTSSRDSRDRSSRRKASKLERPVVGRPTDNRERCLSVSLVVGPTGTAQIQREEVEVEFLERQRELGLCTTAAMMTRMVSSAGSDVSVSRTLNNMSLVNSTRGEVLVRSASMQPDTTHSMPLTPSQKQHQFVSPMLLNRSETTLLTPESTVSSRADSPTHQDNAQLAVQRLFNKSKTTPELEPRVARFECDACHIVFSSRALLRGHTDCRITQTPFTSLDFFGADDDGGEFNYHLFDGELEFGGMLRAVESPSPPKRKRV